MASIKLEQFTVQIRMFKDDLETMKDTTRRMIEESHVQLKQTFTDFTTQIDTYKQTLAMEQEAVQQTQADLREFYAKLDVLAVKVETNVASIDKLSHDKVDAEVFKHSEKEAEKRNQMAWEGLTRVEKQLRETESYLDRQLLMQVQG